MNSIYYTKIGQLGSGLTNQIFTFITSIIISKNTNKRVIICDNFYNDISHDKTTPISEILDMERLNIFLKRYNITVFDKNNVEFNIKRVEYGKNDKKIDITNEMMEIFFDEDLHVLHIPKMFDLNKMKGDPVIGVKKDIDIQYTINDMKFHEINSEGFVCDINFDLMNVKYSYVFLWINSINQTMFEDILKNIVFHKKFIGFAENNNNNISTMNGKINVFHLRLEDDAVNHWSKQNKMVESIFKSTIEHKYISIIEKYIDKSDTNIILSASENNGVIDFLKKNGYNITIPHKYFTNSRELNAIVDLLISKKCENVFIGNFNMQHLNGSTFSYFISKKLDSSVKQVLIDLDRINEPEMIYYNVHEVYNASDLDNPTNVDNINEDDNEYNTTLINYAYLLK